MTDEQYKQRIIVAEWLNQKGYDIQFDRDGFWMEEYRFGEHKTKDVIDLLIDFAQNTRPKSIPLSYRVGYSEKMDDHIKISSVYFDFEIDAPTQWVVHSGRYCMDKNTGVFIQDMKVFAGAYMPNFQFENALEAGRVYLSFHCRELKNDALNVGVECHS